MKRSSFKSDPLCHQVADWLMKEGTHDDDMPFGGSTAPTAVGGGNDKKRRRSSRSSDDSDNSDDYDSDSSMVRKVSSPRSSNQGDIRTMFRPFNMNAMDNVSILFADIVGGSMINK